MKVERTFSKLLSLTLVEMLLHIVFFMNVDVNDFQIFRMFLTYFALIAVYVSANHSSRGS